MITKTTKMTLLEEGRLEQFPHLNFYASEDSLVYFDATHYLEVKNLNKTCSVEKFSSEFATWLEPAQRTYGMSPDVMFVQDAKTEHQMIHESVMVLFLAYTDERYRVEILERIFEMEVTGACMSDPRLIEAVKNRFSKEFVTKMMEKYGQE